MSVRDGSDEESFLNDLVESDSSRKSQYRLRNSKFVQKSVHPADVQSEVDAGWELQRAGKTRSRLRRPKPLWQLLEDRVWCLLYRMGYTTLNGARLVVTYQDTEDRRRKKQIDVLAFDGETAFVVECKSKEKRGRKSLQKDLGESAYLQQFIRRSIYDHFKAKPKIVWVYATCNIIWSEPDVERADDANIHVLTENEMQYLETFVKHMGPASKYQVLGEFLKDQKIPDMPLTRLPAIKGRIGGEDFYTFVVTPEVLQKIAFVNHQALNNPDGQPAYQRMVNSTRIKEIGKFIESGGYFPTNILVNFQKSLKFDLISDSENSDPTIKFGWVTLPQVYRSAWIIDGQHRLFGYSHLADKHLQDSLFVLAFEKLEPKTEADLFITINHKQKSVPKSLLDTLIADLRLGDDDPKVATQAVASAIVQDLNIDKTSPLGRRFITPDVAADEGQNLTISEVIKGLVRSGLIGKVSKRNFIPGPLCGSTDEGTRRRARTVLNGYFEELYRSNTDRWLMGREAYICTNPGIRAHLMLLSEIVQFISYDRTLDFHELPADRFIELVTKFAEPVFQHVSSATDEQIRDDFSRKFGEGGVKEYFFRLCELIHEKEKEFGSSEFKANMEQQQSSRALEVRNFTLTFAEKLTDFVIEQLKVIHGEVRLESGEYAYWDLGIEKETVKDNAYKKQRSDKPGDRKPKEAYLDVIDLKAIVEQANNWPHFEKVINMPMAGERKGKKYYTGWMAEFNDIRKIAAHKNKYRTFSDENIALLEQIRTEIAPGIGLQ